MSSIVTATLLPHGFPAESGYTDGFWFLAAVTALAVVAAMLIPTTPADDHEVAHHAHAELALVPGGTIVEDD